MQNIAIPIRSKLPRTGSSIFSVMSALAKEHNAINLSQGFPNFEMPSELIELTHKAMQKGLNQYAPMAGVYELREAIANKAKSLYNADISPDQNITITSGATQAIYTAITTFVQENEEVIIFEPAYDSYTPAIQVAGGKPIYIPLNAPDYRIPWDMVKKVITTRTRMIILNSPHNPTGTTLQEEDIQELKKFVNGSDILILSDEVYEHITFDGEKHKSLLNCPELMTRTLVCGSFGKTFHNTGWKMGFCIAPAYLMKEFQKVHQFMVFSVNTPVQYALAEYLQNPENYLGLSSFYQQKRDYFLDLMQNSRFKLQPAKGSYFQLADFSEISDEKDTDFVQRLTKEIGVAAIPVSVFYSNNLDEKIIRFCFAKTDETLEQAAKLLCKV